MSINISASLIRDYLECRSKIFYRINYPETSISNKEMILGSIVHSSIEKYWGLIPAAGWYAIDEVKKRFGEDKESEKFVLDCIHVFFKNFRQYLSSIDDKTELKFKIPFSDGVYIVGKIDRITKDGLVFDWKTNRRTPKSINNDPQFILYHWAYSKLYNKTPVAVYYASLTDGSLLMLDIKKEFYGHLFDEIIPAIVQDIKSHNLPKTGIFTGDCFRCPYKETCLQGDSHELDFTNSIEG